MAYVSCTVIGLRLLCQQINKRELIISSSSSSSSSSSVVVVEVTVCGGETSYQVQLLRLRWLANSDLCAVPSLVILRHTKLVRVCVCVCVCMCDVTCVLSAVHKAANIRQASCRRQRVVLHSTKKRTPQQNLHSATNWRRSTTCTLSGGQPAGGGPVRVHHVTGSNLHNTQSPARPSLHSRRFGILLWVTKCLQHDPHTTQPSFRYSALGNNKVSPAQPSLHSCRFGILLWVTQCLQHDPHTTQPSFRYSALGNNKVSPAQPSLHSRRFGILLWVTVPPARPSHYTAVVSAFCCG